jgi:hypothetical protein
MLACVLLLYALAGFYVYSIGHRTEYELYPHEKLKINLKKVRIIWLPWPLLHADEIELMWPESSLTILGKDVELKPSWLGGLAPLMEKKQWRNIHITYLFRHNILPHQWKNILNDVALISWSWSLSDIRPLLSYKDPISVPIRIDWSPFGGNLSYKDSQQDWGFFQFNNQKYKEKNKQDGKLQPLATLWNIKGEGVYRGSAYRVGWLWPMGEKVGLTSDFVEQEEWRDLFLHWQGVRLLGSAHWTPSQKNQLPYLDLTLRAKSFFFPFMGANDHSALEQFNYLFDQFLPIAMRYHADVEIPLLSWHQGVRIKDLQLVLDGDVQSQRMNFIGKRGIYGSFDLLLQRSRRADPAGDAWHSALTVNAASAPALLALMDYDFPLIGSVDISWNLDGFGRHLSDAFEKANGDIIWSMDRGLLPSPDMLKSYYYGDIIQQFLHQVGVSDRGVSPWIHPFKVQDGIASNDQLFIGTSPEALTGKAVIDFYERTINYQLTSLTMRQNPKRPSLWLVIRGDLDAPDFLIQELAPSIRAYRKVTMNQLGLDGLLYR